MHELAIKITYTRLFHVVSIIFDFVSITYFIYSFFFLEQPFITFELLLGTYFLVEYILLMQASENRWQYVRHPLAISNVLIIIGYLIAPFWNLGFLRILRILRVIHFYQIIPDIRIMTNRIIVWEKVLALLIHVLVLIFIMSEIIYLLQANVNTAIITRFDAFYFTTNAIIKAGNGETIELIGVQGRILTLFIAFLSISVFVQLLDTARDVQRLVTNKQKKATEKEDMKEIYSEQYCTYCDIKNRETIRKKL